MRKHSGEMPFSCSHCPKRFRSMRNLENHSRIHTGEKPFKCRTCGRRFTTSSGLCQHFKKSSGCRRNLEDTTGSYTANLEENSDTQIRTCIILVSAGEIILNIWIWGGAHSEVSGGGQQYWVYTKNLLFLSNKGRSL